MDSAAAAACPALTTTEYKEIYSVILTRYSGRENARKCIGKFLSELVLPQQGGLRVLLIGPGKGVDELKLLAPYQIDHLLAIEPSKDMADELEINLHASASFIKKWNIERTDIESYLKDANHDDGPFDVILMIHSVYYPTHRGDTIRQIRSLLRPHTGQFMLVIIFGCYSTITSKYIPSSKHGYNADDLANDLSSVDIPFERYKNNVRLDVTDIKDDSHLRWVFASFFLTVNVAHADESLTSGVINDLIDMANRTDDGKLKIEYREDVFVIRPME